MSFTDGLASRGPTSATSPGPLVNPQGVALVTLTGTYTLTSAHRQVLKLDPDGANRDVVLPDAQAGLMFQIINNGGGGSEDLVVKRSATDGGATLVTIDQNEAAILYCSDESTPVWYLLYSFTIALA